LSWEVDQEFIKVSPMRGNLQDIAKHKETLRKLYLFVLRKTEVQVFSTAFLIYLCKFNILANLE
jgi:hypothetical protein